MAGPEENPELIPMARFSYKILQKLQNGSDIRGVAMGGVPGEEVNLTKEVAGQLGVEARLRPSDEDVM